MRYFVLLTVIAAAAAQTVSTPIARAIHDGSGHLRRVLGIPGNFILGTPDADGVLSAAFSGASGLAKTDSSLLLLDRNGLVVTSFPAPSGAAQFAFYPDGTPALVWFADTAALWRVDNGGLTGAPLDTSGFADTVLAIAAQGRERARVVVRRGPDVLLETVSLDSGLPESSETLPGIANALFARDLLLMTGENGLTIRHGDGTETRIALDSNPGALELMSDRWVHVFLRGGSRVLVIPTERVYQLPQAAASK